MKNWLVFGIAAVVGFGIGAWTTFGTSAGHLLPLSDASKSGAPTASKSKFASLDLPALSVGDFGLRLERLLTGLKGAGKDELLTQLQIITDDKTILPALADYYRKELLRRLVEFGAAKEAITCGDPRQREEAVRIVVGLLALRDANAAEALRKKLPAGIEQQMAGEAILEALGKTKPERGLELLRANPELRGSNDRFFEAWAAQEPQAATLAALQLQKEIGSSCLNGAVYRWAADDPATAWKWIEGQPPDIREEAQRTYVNAIVNKDPAAALETLLAKPELGSGFADWIGAKLVENKADAEILLAHVPPGEIRTELVQGIVRKLLDTDPEEAIAWAQTLLPGEQEAAIRSVFRDLADDDPAMAMNLASSHLKGPSAGEAIASIAREWASRDFESAFSAVTHLLNGDALKRTLPDMMMGQGYLSIGTDIGPRLALVSRLEPDVKKEVLRSMGVQLGMNDPRGAQGHLEGLDPKDRDAMVEGLILGMSSGVPRLPAEYAKLLSPEKQLANAQPIARAISFTDPAGAASFLTSLPGDLKSRAPAMKDLVHYWSYEDPEAAVNFVATLPFGEGKDTVALELGRQLRTFDPDGATRQLAGISGADARAALLRDLAETWNRVDPDRGRALLLSSAKSDEERQIVTASMEAR